MDFTFNCPRCEQEFVVDTSLAGTTVECPSCNASIIVPQPAPGAVPPIPAPAAPALGGKEEKHYVVPLHEGPSEVLIKKPAPTLEVAAREEEKKIRVHCIRRVDCMEVGKDHFDERVTEFLQKVGHQYIISINTV